MIQSPNNNVLISVFNVVYKAGLYPVIDVIDKVCTDTCNIHVTHAVQYWRLELDTTV